MSSASWMSTPFCSPLDWTEEGLMLWVKNKKINNFMFECLLGVVLAISWKWVYSVTNAYEEPDVNEVWAKWRKVSENRAWESVEYAQNRLPRQLGHTYTTFVEKYKLHSSFQWRCERYIKWLHQMTTVRWQQ